VRLSLKRELLDGLALARAAGLPSPDEKEKQHIQVEPIGRERFCGQNEDVEDSKRKGCLH
jgi:hypothetical protein